MIQKMLSNEELLTVLRRQINFEREEEEGKKATATDSLANPAPRCISVS